MNYDFPDTKIGNTASMIWNKIIKKEISKDFRKYLLRISLKKSLSSSIVPIYWMIVSQFKGIFLKELGAETLKTKTTTGQLPTFGAKIRDQPNFFS